MKKFNVIKLLPAFLVIFTLACSLSNVPASSPAKETYRYDNLPDGSDAEAAEYRAISRWEKTNIAYYFINGTDKLEGDRERDLIRAAFALWAEQTPLTFSEADSSGQADIVIGWAVGNHGDGDPFDGPGDVLAHASYPNPYEDRQVFLHFDDDERWVDSETRNVDLLTVAAHEIGHTLGFDHSKDPNALMYPRYSEPHRFLGKDDIAGAQAVYGSRSEAPSGPQIPSPEATPPSSPGKDSDGDGLSDSGETLITGTDPKNPDSDGDGLSDGVEVVNRMNPLDPDMDNDGATDGAEIAAGTNPLLPDQSNGIQPQLANEVSAFLTNAIELQIKAYRNGNASIASSSLAGDVYRILESNINDLNQKGLVEIAQIDYYKSYIDNIRVISNTRIEADTCETWTTQIYRASDGVLTKSDGPALLPQTITIERLQNSWFITGVKFFDAPAFCRP